MFEHWRLDTNPKKGNAQDPSYEEPEHYYDPDFDSAWNEDGGDSGEFNSDIISENPPQPLSEPDGEPGDFDVIPPIDPDGTSDWEEV